MPPRRKEPTEQDIAEQQARARPEIENYRIAEFMQLGFSQYQSNVLANLPTVYRSVSWVRESFLKRGCSLELTWRILGNDDLASTDPDRREKSPESDEFALARN